MKLRNYMVGIFAGFLTVGVAMGNTWVEEKVTLSDGDILLVASKHADIGNAVFGIACSIDEREIYPAIDITRNGRATDYPILNVIDTHFNDLDSLTDPFIKTSYRFGRGMAGMVYTLNADNNPFSAKEYMESIDLIRDFGHTFRTPFGTEDVYFHSLEGIKNTKAWEYCAESN